jgi:glycosyltransferase involved in cell wall biosynthesis
MSQCFSILYLIAIDGGKGSGGHYHSLDQISKEVAKDNKIGIISIGVAPSPILVNNPYFLSHITAKTNILSIYKLNKKIKGLLCEFKPNIIHCFDTNSLNRVLLCPSTFRIPIAWTKCGGKNPLGANYQHADGIILFSEENMNWFKRSDSYDNKRLFLIPNRVHELSLQKNKFPELNKDNSKITFIRISRLGGAYEKTLRDSFNLIELLNRDIDVQLIVVGIIQDEMKFQKLEREAIERKLPVVFLTDNRAARGSDFLFLGDYVIGTGRSFMEAISLGIPTLAPAVNASIPILINESNFMEFLSSNFSERSIAPLNSIISNIDSIKILIHSKIKYDEFSKTTKELFMNHLSADKIPSLYNSFYLNIVNNKVLRMHLIIRNIKYIFRFLLIGR